MWFATENTEVTEYFLAPDRSDLPENSESSGLSGAEVN
jgi:hypothetical protein